MKKIYLALCFGITAIAFSSCAERVVVSERPAPPVYARPIAPGPRYIWIDGDWYVQGGRYIWREGYWAPPRQKHWEGGHWAPRRGGWYWQRGHWR